MWYLYEILSGCTGAGLFIGCTADSNGVGGTALVNVSNGAKIDVSNRADAPGVKVGLSGTLTGNGLVAIGPASGNTALSKTAEVFGTLAPTGALEIRGNLDLKDTANTVCHVTPQGGDNVQITQLTGGGVMRPWRPVDSDYDWHLYGRYVVHSPARGPSVCMRPSSSSSQSYPRVATHV